MITPVSLGRRSSVAVLAVIATAVAMLGLLVAQTSRQGRDTALATLVSRQRVLSERLIAEVHAVRAAAPARRAALDRERRQTAARWREATDRISREIASDRTDTSEGEARMLAEALALENQVLALGDRAVANASRAEVADTLGAKQRLYATTIDSALAMLESSEGRRVERLVQLEAVCVVLLLAALAIVIRLVLAPAQERLAATVTALAESESRNRAVLDSMREGMLLTDADGRIVAWNPSAQRALALPGDVGLPSMESLMKRVVNERGQRITPDELPSRVTLRTGQPLTDSLLGVTDAKGALRWLAVSTQPIVREGETAPHAVVSIFRDVTDARLREEERAAQSEALELQNQELLEQAEALERERALFRSLVDTAGNAIVGLDTEGRIFEWNREAEATFGVARADALERNFAEELIPVTHRERMTESIRAALQGNTIRNLTGPVRAADGTRRTVIWNVAPLRFGAAEPVHGLIVAGLDITEREASEERFRVLFERSSDAHLLLDDEGIIDCNDATLRLLNYDSKEAVVGRTAADLSPRRQPDGRLSVVVGAQMRQKALDRGFHRFEWTHQRADGSEFPVEITLTPVRLDGREVVLSVWHDIAERKSVEDALRAAKEAAESANRMKSEFMTRMNHELRTPLTAIIGFSRVLLQGKQGELAEGARLYVDRVRANGMHLLSLINQILDVAKVEAGRMELELGNVEVDMMVRDIVSMLDATAEAKGITLRTEMPPRLASIVTDDPKLRQILINLVGNAIKFTQRGEVVIHVSADPDTRRPRSIRVQDTGIGIPLDRQEKVFEPFEQGDASTRREYGGTGLGLAIVKAFATLIRAQVEVTSEVGVGTAFTVWLPEDDLAPRSGV